MTNLRHKQPTTHEVRDELGVSAIGLRPVEQESNTFEFVIFDEDGNELERDLDNPMHPRAAPVYVAGLRNAQAVARVCARVTDKCQWVLRIWELK
jgi:hypothetical protein